MPRLRLLAPLLASLFIAGLLACSAQADTLLRIDTRPGVQVPVYEMLNPAAHATLVLLPGGNGGFGKLVDGAPSSQNFLVRERQRFVDAGFHVAVVSRPSDIPDLDNGTRTGEAHLADLRQVVTSLKARHGKPVWLIGTSRGTVSAAAAAIALGDELAGIVMTSSILAWKLPGALPRQALDKIRIPVLMVHHQDDACWACRAYEAPAVLRALNAAPFRELILISGGGPVSDDACEPHHYHGFIGKEAETIQHITDWIRQPRSAAAH